MDLFLIAQTVVSLVFTVPVSNIPGSDNHSLFSSARGKFHARELSLVVEFSAVVVENSRPFDEAV